MIDSHCAPYTVGQTQMTFVVVVPLRATRCAAVSRLTRLGVRMPEVLLDAGAAILEPRPISPRRCICLL